MDLKQLVAFALFVLMPFSAAVAGQKVVQLSPDTYMAICDSKAGMFASMATLKGKAIALAGDFAAERGKVAVAISTKENRAIPIVNSFPSVEYQFRLVDPDDPAANATAPSAATPAGQQAQHRDIYAELERLDELRQKGIITQDEFDTQKKKVLASQP